MLPLLCLLTTLFVIDYLLGDSECNNKRHNCFNQRYFNNNTNINNNYNNNNNFNKNRNNFNYNYNKKKMFYIEIITRTILSIFNIIANNFP